MDGYGLILVFGEESSGKTTFALTVPNVKKILFIDDDSSKGKLYADWLRQEKEIDVTYVDLRLKTTSGLSEQDTHTWVYDTIKAAKPGEYDLIVFDNPTRFFNAGSPVWFKQSARRSVYAGTGEIRGATANRDYSKIWLPEFFTLCLRVAPTVIFAAHEKDKYDPVIKQTIGEREPDVKYEPIRRAASFIVRLVRNRFDPNSAAPSGLVVKNLAIRPMVRILPNRIPVCDWDHILGYIENPVSTRNEPLLPEEQPNEDEWHLIEGTQTAEQKRYVEYLMALQSAKIEENSEEDIASKFAEYGDWDQLSTQEIALRALAVHGELVGKYPLLTQNGVHETIMRLMESNE